MDAGKEGKSVTAPDLYKSPLECLREERAKLKQEKDKAADQMKRKLEEETRLLSTRKVGALLKPPTAAPQHVTPSSLSGKRRNVFERLAPEATTTSKRVASSTRDRNHKATS